MRSSERASFWRASSRSRAASRSAIATRFCGRERAVEDRDLEREEGPPGLRRLEQAGGRDVARREGRRHVREPVLPRVRGDALRARELGREELDVRPLLQPGVVRRDDRRGQDRLALGAQRARGEHRHAQGFLPPPHQQRGELHQALGARPLLHRPHVIQAAALAGFEPGARVVLEDLGRVAVAHDDLELTLGRDHGEVGLGRADRDLEARLPGGDPGGLHAVRGLVLGGPAGGREHGIRRRRAEPGLGARLDDAAVEAAGVVEHRRAHVPVRERQEHAARLAQQRLGPQDRLRGLADARVVGEGAAHRLVERDLLENGGVARDLRLRGRRAHQGEAEEREAQRDETPTHGPPPPPPPALARPGRSGAPCPAPASGSRRRAPE